MQSGTAISCDLGETVVTADKIESGQDCRKELQTQCGLQGRVVSQLKFNAWDPKNIGEKVCEGCCRVPPPCPAPVEWTKCAVTDTDKTFKIENYTGNDCHLCEEGCKTRCDESKSKVADQICGYLVNDDKTVTGLYCTCCCRENVPCLPPQPPAPPPPPSCPSPPTCPCNTEVNVNVKHNGQCQC
ncbi:hypothetical protein MKW92_051507 [Papaver armeniacum]|nr:hypothetical protein MKW92_051507 [Papaver armeniacum]